MLHILKAKHLVFNYRFSSAFLIRLRNSDNFVVEEEIKTTDKTMETFQKKKRGEEKVNLNQIWKRQKQQMHCQNAGGGGQKSANTSLRRGFYLYIRRACRHQTFIVSVLQRRRRKESETPASLTFVITQSNSQPASANSSAHLAPDPHVLEKTVSLTVGACAQTPRKQDRHATKQVAPTTVGAARKRTAG